VRAATSKDLKEQIGSKVFFDLIDFEQARPQPCSLHVAPRAQYSAEGNSEHVKGVAARLRLPRPRGMAQTARAQQVAEAPAAAPQAGWAGAVSGWAGME